MCLRHCEGAIPTGEQVLAAHDLPKTSVTTAFGGSEAYLLL